MKTSEQDIRITVRFPAEVAAALRASAREHQRSLNGEIVWAAKEYLARQPKPRKQESR